MTQAEQLPVRRYSHEVSLAIETMLCTIPFVSLLKELAVFLSLLRGHCNLESS